MGKILQRSLLLILTVMAMSTSLHATPNRITSVTLNPPNPGYGDMVIITVQMCAAEWQTIFNAVAISTFSTPQSPGVGGQVFVVDINGIDRRDVTFGASAQVGLEYPSAGANTGCTDCSGGMGVAKTFVYTVHVPTADYFTTCNPSNLYVIVGSTGYMGTSNWTALAPAASCGGNGSYFSVPIPIGVPAPSYSLSKRAEGVLQLAGDMVLYSVDYKYAGAGAFTITDPIPGGGAFTLVDYGPKNGASVTVAAPAIGATSGTISWTYPTRAALPGAQSGTVWMLLRHTAAPVAGTVYTNTASVTRGTTTSVSASITAGRPAVSIMKNQNVNSVLSGSNVTYVLSYDVNGYALRSFQPIDGMANGTYSSPTAPPGWRFKPDGSESGTWTISEQCSSGGKVITSAAAGYTYPGLLLDDGTAADSDQFCTGMIVSDIYIDDGGFIGADAQIIVRTNGQTAIGTGRTLGIVASIDNAPGVFYSAQCGGPSEFCGSTLGPAGSWTNTPQVGILSAQKWYRIRIVVTDVGGGQQRIQAKIWARGDPEVPNWDINYINTNMSDATWLCDGSGTWNDWRPGVNQQTSSVGVKDSYDNFVTYRTRSTSADTIVYDTVPAGITYGGCNGCAAGGPVVRWNLGTVSMTSGSYTWWGQANGCVPVSNQALIGGTGMASIASNWTELEVLCWSPTFTPSPTQNPNSPTFTVTRTFTPTSTLTRTPTLTFTSTATPTHTRTRTPTSTYTNTPASSPTFTRTATSTNTPTYTNTNSPTPSFSSTPTRTATSTYTGTNSPTPTYTATPTRTMTASYTATRTHTPTITDTPTYTIFTMTVTPTSTPTFTSTQTFTVTPSPTHTRTATPTGTPTPTRTDTNSPTATPTATFTRTHTPTITETETFTIFTKTVTPTFTPTFTMTYTPTVTNTPVDTATFTPTRTATETVTQTSINTATNTPTVTRTFTPTFTGTNTPTYTSSATQTLTMTYTPTFTTTRTVTMTYTYTYTVTDTPTATVTPTQPENPALLAISMSVKGYNPQQDSRMFYTIKIENKDTVPVRGVHVWDTLPAELTFVAMENGLPPVVNGNLLAWEFPDGTVLQPGGSIYLRFEVSLSGSDWQGSVMNSASTDYYDPYYTPLIGRHPALTASAPDFPEAPPVAFPNPFNRTTAVNNELKFANIAPGSSLQIYTLSGERVITIAVLLTKAGWNCKNSYGNPISPGIYYYVIRNMFSNEVVTGKIYIIK